MLGPVGDPLKRVDARIVRAEIHRNAFDKRVNVLRDFVQQNLIRQTNLDGSEHSYDLRLPEWDMDTFIMFASDVLHNARAALDNLAYRLSELNQERLGQAITDEKAGDIYFPICGNAHNFSSEAGSALPLVSRNARKLIRGYQPYNRPDPIETDGVPLFWGLRQLQNVDKHRFLVNLGFEFGGLRADAFPGHTIAMTPGEALRAVNGPQDGMHFCTFTVDPPNPDLDLKPDPAIFICFDKGPWDRRHVGLVLWRLLDAIADLYRDARSLPECVAAEG